MQARLLQANRDLHLVGLGKKRFLAGVWKDTFRLFGVGKPGIMESSEEDAASIAGRNAFGFGYASMCLAKHGGVGIRHPIMDDLQRAKTESDAKRYEQKQAIMRKVLADRGDEFYIDQEDSHYPGVTHAPTGFRMHLPREMLGRLQTRLNLSKTADDAELATRLVGKLYIADSGWGLLAVPNALVRGAFDALHELGAELPLRGGRLNAHISIFRPEEIEQIGGPEKLTERGHMFFYNLGALYSAAPTGWPDVSRCWFFRVHSPELEKVRKSYGLPPTPKHPFHLTVAIRKKRVLQNSGVTKTADLRVGEIRQLTAADVAAAREIETASFPEAYPEEVFHLAADTNRGLVADLGGKVAGYALFDFNPCDSAGRTELTSIAVHPGYRRGGIASQLIGALQDRFDGLYLRVENQNHKAQQVYKQAGFGSPRPIENDDANWLVWDKPQKQAEAADAYIIRGNPEVMGEDAAKYDDFYNAIKQHIESKGLTADFDPGLDHTLPPGGKYWLGHSRGQSRLPYAPAGVQTLRLDDSEPEEIRQAQQSKYDELFQQLGVSRIADVPMEQRPKPGPEHYTFSATHQAAIDKLLDKQAGSPMDQFRMTNENLKLAYLLGDLVEERAKIEAPKSKEQADAGNYRKGRVRMHGLPITLENAKGSTRSGVGENGRKWSVEMAHDYGYIRGTEANDGDHLDVFIGPNHESKQVFIVKQVRPKTRRFDEWKCMLGFDSEKEAKAGYLANYSSGWQGLGSIEEMTIDEFKDWVRTGTYKTASCDTAAIRESVLNAIRGLPAQGGYGDVLWNDTTHTLWVVLGDGDEQDVHDQWKQALDMLPGVEAVETHAEAYPSRDDEAWTHLNRDKSAALLDTVQLQPHQKRIQDKAEENEQAGIPTRMLLYHQLGSGKSLSSIAAGEKLGPYTAIAPAALRPNYEKELTKFTDRQNPVDVASYNSLAAGYEPQNPNTLIFDEAQRLRTDDSKATQQAFNLSQKAKNVLLLSGTPIVNGPEDLAPMLSMIEGKKVDPKELASRYSDTQEVEPTWWNYLMGNKPGTHYGVKNEDELRDRLAGKVDFHAAKESPVDVNNERHEVELSPEQAMIYRGFWKDVPWLTRWRMNNDYALEPKELARMKSFLAGPRQVGLSPLPFMKTKDPLKAYQQSAKLQMAVAKLKEELKTNPESRALVFSNFIDAGLTPYAAGLNQEKIPHGIFHGGLTDAQRKQVVEDYNNGKIKAMLLGPSGSEGLSTKGTRLIQQLDPHWQDTRVDQNIGRGVRYDSHSHMPEEDRKVKIQRFVSKLSPTMYEKLFGDMPVGSIDQYLERAAQRKTDVNKRFLQILQEVGTHQ